MTRVACPNCGFLNFSISAYCGRCERPLKRDDTPLSRRATPQPAGAETPPARRTPRASGRRTDPVIVPPPAPPPKTNVTPAPLPIELKLPEPEQPRDALAEGRTAAEPPRPDAEEPPPPPLSTEVPPVEEDDAEVPVAIASGFRLGIAWSIDATLVIGVGAAIAGLEALIFGAPFHAQGLRLIDTVADWLFSNPGPAWHGTITAILFGIGYSLYASKRGGRTLGRLLTGTVLVRASGRGLGWPRIVLRTVAGLLSFGLFGAGFFWSIIDSRHRTWHDLLAGTVIVRRHV